MTTLLVARDVRKSYGRHEAVRGVSLSVAQGETLGIVGESGSGKSTLARMLLHLEKPDAGTVTFDGENLAALTQAALRRRRRDMQMVFQDPRASLDPRMTVFAQIEEPLVIHGIGDRGARRARVAGLLARVGLDAGIAALRPHLLSGGQRQRVAIARALAAGPKLLVADEPVSALDVSVQAQILNLLADLKAELGLAMVFVSHDLAVVRHVSDRVAVMRAGEIVEQGDAARVLERPAHDYTRALRAAASDMQGPF